MTELNQNDDTDLAQQNPDDEDILNQEEADEAGQDESLVQGTYQSSVVLEKEQDEGDDNELALSDDAEADLLTILQNKIHAENKEEEDDSEAVEEDTVESTNDLLILPRKKDEQHCQRCWLLVRNTAPKCPVHDDDCPIFQVVG